jgi:N-acetylmuramoyl-L-alanine amidase
MTPLSYAFDGVVLDPGHGGNDEGTAWYRVKEKDTTLAVALRLEKLLKASGVKCLLTRRTDIYVSLDDRVTIANQHPQSLFLSIHFNASSTSAAAGFATYYFAHSPSGRFFARTIQEALDESHATPNRGIRSQDFAVLVNTIGCAVLVECGFLSNRAEAQRFASAEGQQWLAEALLVGITRTHAVQIEDPPETHIAKCEVYAKRMEEKERKRKRSSPPPRPVEPPKVLTPTSKNK